MRSNVIGVLTTVHSARQLRPARRVFDCRVAFDNSGAARSSTDVDLREARPGSVPEERR